MHIKQVIIEGFKSYKEQVATEPFSPRINCVVGANGSGKSNFFHAIRFVLSDLFQNLRNEDRISLLHEGVGPQVPSAFVEIVFDNSDNRLPVGKEEVRLRRKISCKKDDYVLNGKLTTKAEVVSLLECAGFSRSNPYYVVQQGKISSLTLMKDSERLDLLKEIGGSQVYEERRSQSLKVIRETDGMRIKIAQQLRSLDERLDELGSEKEEFKKYQLIEKQRKSIEHAIYSKESRDTRQHLAEIDEAHCKISLDLNITYNSLLEAAEKLKEKEEKVKDLAREIQRLSEERKSTEEERARAIKKLAQVESDDRELEEEIIDNIKTKEELLKNLEILQRKIQDIIKEFNDVKGFHCIQVSEEEKIRRRLVEVENKLGSLNQKKARVTHFASKAARDKWLLEEINEYERVLSSSRVQEEILKNEIQQLNADLRDQDSSIDHGKNEISALKSLISEHHVRNSEYELARNKVHEERKSLLLKESEISSEIGKLKDEILKAEDTLNRVIPRDFQKGLMSVRNICEDPTNNIKHGVYGPIIELLDCDEKYFTAVESSAGNRLFSVVVQDDKIATQIIQQLNALRGGRVTFIPLNKVTVPNVTYPLSPEPLLRKLIFPDECYLAFAEVFAYTLVCEDPHTTTKIDGFNCITLEGDQMSGNGGMTGGYYDPENSILKLMSVVKKIRNNISQKEIELDGVASRLQEIDQKITELVSELHSNGAKLFHDKQKLEQRDQELTSATRHKQSLALSLDTKVKLLANTRTEMDQIMENISKENEEMGTEFVTSKEQELASKLYVEVTDLKEKLDSCRTHRIKMEERKNELEANLSLNLLRQKQELEALISSTDNDVLLNKSEVMKQEIKDLKAFEDNLEKKFEGLCASVDDVTEKIKKNNADKDLLQKTQDKYKRNYEDQGNQLKQLASKRDELLAKQDDISNKIGDLGQLTSDFIETNGMKSLKELQKMLGECTEQLRKFSHVNKLASIQYETMSNERERFQKRRADLDSEYKKIEELISALDQQKDELIERTFKEVAKNFSTVFSELVQGGHGSLIMMKRKDGDGGGDSQDEEDAEHEAGKEGVVENYIGVKVKVSFTGQGETKTMKQLSGGQKTVVALALIFAIQRCDPAPIYLFDEIDAALDPEYRTAVTGMISRLADTTNTQFIATTFRPELVRVADKIYGVTHRNSVSTVDIVSKEEALDFVEREES